MAARSPRPLPLLSALAMLVALAGCAGAPAGSGARTYAAGPGAAQLPDSLRANLAVLAFENNTGVSRYDPLGRGLADMMTSDLSAVPSLRLVERVQMQALVDELELQQTEYFDPATALRVGRFIGAEHVVIGSVAAVEPQMRIDTRVVEVETSEVVQTASVTGRSDDLFDLQQRLAASLIEGIEVVLSPEAQAALRARQEANRMDDAETMLAYSEALALYDAGDYVSAVERLNVVRQRAPSSALVPAALGLARQGAQNRARDEVRRRINRVLGGL